jgi:inosine-uridine nucleoside N-ribohydrolase
VNGADGRRPAGAGGINIVRGADHRGRSRRHRATVLEERDLGPLAQLDGWRARLALHFVRYLMASYRRLGRPAQCVLHDPLSAGVCLDPDLVTTARLHVDIETRGELTRGMTVADRRPAPAKAPSVEVALSVDAGRFQAEFLDALVRWAAQEDTAATGQRWTLPLAA